MTPVRCIVFDVDDTLYLERDYVRSGFNAAGEWLARTRGVEGLSAIAWREFTGGARGNIFNRALMELEVEPDRALIDGLVSAYRNHVPDIMLASDAMEAIQTVGSGIARAVLTDGPLESQRHKVAALGLERWMHPVVFGATLGEGNAKPSAFGFRLIEQECGLSGPQCAYVADNPLKDFVGPKALGWRTVRIRRSGGLHAGVPSGADVDFETDNLPAAVRHLS